MKFTIFNFNKNTSLALVFYHFTMLYLPPNVIQIILKENIGYNCKEYGNII